MRDALLDRGMWSPASGGLPPRSWGETPESPEPSAPYMAKPSGNDKLLSEHALSTGAISVLNRLYEFRGGLVVEEFLRKNLHQKPYLAGVLVEAHGVIRDHFDSRTRLILEVVTDPSAPTDQQLFVVIRTRFPRKIARDLLSVLRQKWWRRMPLAVRTDIELDVE